MRKRWWQYERQQPSEVYRGAAWLWLAFGAVLLVIEIGEWRPAGFAAASSALAVATWHFKRSRDHARSESGERAETPRTGNAKGGIP